MAGYLCSPTDGFYNIYAEIEGYVRSNSELLKVGTPSSGSVNLNLTFDNGSVEGDETGPGGGGEGSVSFVVNPTNLNFGTLVPGASSQDTVNISNNGSVDLHIESIVSGDEIFQNFLNIDSKHWPQFETELAQTTNQDYTVEISIPSNYAGSKGAKQGEITFWAIAN